MRRVGCMEIKWSLLNLDDDHVNGVRLRLLTAATNESIVSILISIGKNWFVHQSCLAVYQQPPSMKAELAKQIMNSALRSVSYFEGLFNIP
jgi:hypothetical protein